MNLRNPVGKTTGDHSGHLIAHVFGGSSGADNIVAMSGDLNVGTYLDMEREWRKRLLNGEQFGVTINVLYDANSNGRPSGFRVLEIIDGSPKNQRSFTN